VTVAAKTGQFTADETGKRQFLRRNLAGKGVVRKISSPQRVASVFNLCNGCQWAGNMGNGDVAPVLPSKSAHSFPGSLA